MCVQKRKEGADRGAMPEPASSPEHNRGTWSSAKCQKSCQRGWAASSGPAVVPGGAQRWVAAQPTMIQHLRMVENRSSSNSLATPRARLVGSLVRSRARSSCVAAALPGAQPRMASTGSSSWA